MLPISQPQNNGFVESFFEIWYANTPEWLLIINTTQTQYMLMPVSYTHLDVYKRQALFSEAICIYSRKDDTETTSALPKYPTQIDLESADWTSEAPTDPVMCFNKQITCLLYTSYKCLCRSISLMPQRAALQMESPRRCRPLPSLAFHNENYPCLLYTSRCV